jgi:signal transduction histidine kinase
VKVSDSELFLLISNGPSDGSGSGQAGGGMGMVGMKERVQLYEGTLDAGPQPGGGYRVQARIPLSLGAG